MIQFAYNNMLKINKYATMAALSLPNCFQQHK